MTYKRCLFLEVFALVICIVFMVILSPFSSDKNTDISFATDTSDVTITATSYPDCSFQEFDWILEWDEDNNSTIGKLVLNNKEPTDYVTITPNGSECVVTFVQYYKVLGIKSTVYLKLTAISIENEEATAICTIKL